jgi:hypothetical protein
MNKTNFFTILIDFNKELILNLINDLNEINKFNYFENPIIHVSLFKINEFENFKIDENYLFNNYFKNKKFKIESVNLIIGNKEIFKFDLKS